MGWEVSLKPKLRVERRRDIAGLVLFVKGLNVHLSHDHWDDGVEAVDHVTKLWISVERNGKCKEETKKDAWVGHKEFHHSLANLRKKMEDIF